MRKADFIDLDGNWYVSPLTELADAIHIDRHYQSSWR